MKILIATDAFWPQISGVVTTLNNLNKELDKLGHTAKFIEPNIFFNVPTPGYKEIPISFPIQIKKKIQEFQPDAIHIHTEGIIGFYVSKFCKINQIPYTTAYATNFAEMIYKKYFIPEQWSWRYLRKFHNNASKTIVGSEAVVEELKSFGIKNPVSIGKGVDTTQFNSKFKITLPYQKPIWLYVGRISMEKNLEDFLKLELPGTKLCIGRGPDLNRYAKKYPKVHFIGHKIGNELASYYASADVFVFPSRWDTFGLVMLEASACGTPIAAYPVRGPLQAVSQYITGYLDEDLSVACMQALKLNRTIVEQYTANHFNWTNVANNFVTNLEIIKY